MIEVISEERCTKCDICVRVCPTNVFDRGIDGFPVIARQADCQTCFMCEAWCPEEALFVAHPVEAVAADSKYRNLTYVTEQQLLGAYRRALGWGRAPAPVVPAAD